MNVRVLTLMTADQTLNARTQMVHILVDVKMATRVMVSTAQVTNRLCSVRKFKVPTQ